MTRIWTKHKQLNTTLKPKVFVAMSGGVDSSVAAALLKDEGYDVTGVHMICWEGCENNQDKQDVMRVCAVLGIPFLIWDFKNEYKEAVYDYILREYMEGRTPNPDVMCNKEIKFGIFLKRALQEGADFIATGHYIRREPEFPISNFQFPKSENSSIEDCRLKISKDLNKDQSYFLWTLTQEQLKYCLFPVGDYLKSEVRELARKFGLPTSEKKDSQGLCFIGNIDFQEFLKSRLPKKTGLVLFADGKKIGEHDGAHFYTLGQRHGLGIGGQKEPIYIAEKNIESNTITVAEGEKDPILFKNELVAGALNWLSGALPDFPLHCMARIRYRQPLQDAIIFEGGRVTFLKPQRAIATGQSIVFYRGDEMLGGAIIK